MVWGGGAGRGQPTKRVAPARGRSTSTSAAHGRPRAVGPAARAVVRTGGRPVEEGGGGARDEPVAFRGHALVSFFLSFARTARSGAKLIGFCLFCGVSVRIFGPASACGGRKVDRGCDSERERGAGVCDCARTGDGTHGEHGWGSEGSKRGGRGATGIFLCPRASQGEAGTERPTLAWSQTARFFH